MGRVDEGQGASFGGFAIAVVEVYAGGGGPFGDAAEGEVDAVGLLLFGDAAYASH